MWLLTDFNALSHITVETILNYKEKLILVQSASLK